MLRVCEFGESICKFGCVFYFVVECYVMLYLIYHVWSSKECVCCACDPSERLDAHSICFVCVLYVGGYLLIEEFKS